MADKFMPLQGNAFREAVCINANKVYDTCRDRDCMEDLRVYLTSCGQSAVDNATSVKCKKAEVIWTYIDVEAVPFNRGYYSIDITFYFKICLEVLSSESRPNTVEGLAVFEKKCILFGSDGQAKVFSSTYRPCASDIQHGERSNNPKAVVEVVNPIVLDCRSVCACDACFDSPSAGIPEPIREYYREDFVNGGDTRVYVTLGMFSIVRLEREVQLLMPACDFCVPEKICDCNEEKPCDLFSRMHFPVEQFFPPAQQCINQSGDRNNSCSVCK